MDLPGNSQPRPRAGRCTPDSGGRRDPDRVLQRTHQADGGQGSPSTASPATTKAPTTFVGGEELSDAERDQLLELCRQRLDAFRMQRGEEVFAHRSRHPWRWTTSCPGTRAARTNSATCRPSASAAMPPSDGRQEAGAHRRADAWSRLARPKLNVWQWPENEPQ